MYLCFVMERYIHITLSVCAALVIFVAGLLGLEHSMQISTSSLHYNNIIETQVEEYNFESESVGNISTTSRLRTNNCPVRHLTSRTPLRSHSQQRVAKSTTFKLGKTIDCRIVIAQSIMQGLLPMATKNLNRLIIRIHKLSIEP